MRSSRGVPGQRHRAGPELLDDRLLERLVVLEGHRRHRRDRWSRPRRTASSSSSSSSMRSASTEHLLLLQRHARHPGAGARLQEEGALPGRADRARDEPLRRVEAVDHRCHGAEPRRVAPSAATDGGVAARPCGCGRFLRRWLRGGRGRRPTVFMLTTNGRSGRVADHRQRRRVDHDPLERVEVDAERVGEDRLDHVAVADRDPDRVGPVLGLDARRPSGGPRRPPGRTCPPSTRRRGTPPRDGCACTVAPHRLLGQRLELAAGPRAVVALEQAPLGAHLRRRRLAPGDRRGRSPGTARAGWMTTAASGTPGQPLARGPGLLDARGRRGARPCSDRPAPRSRSRWCGRAGPGSRLPWRRSLGHVP